jgi:hypothetical protein
MIALVAVLYLLFVASPAGRICRRIGFSPYLGILAIVPVANVAFLLYVAFANWPAVPGDGARTP